LGQKAEYHPPDKNAIAIYDWKDERGNLVKQVLRYPNKSDGSKDFRQRRPGKGGDWIRNTVGVPPMLFNLDLLHIFHSDVVAITEGEKDACTVTNLSLRDATNGSGWPIIATTSGAAGTWKKQFAKQLATKPLNSGISSITRPRYTKAVVMADADEHGKGVEHAEQVKASLEAEGIECRVVTFEDVGAKDVTEFLEEHSVKELVRRIGVDWVCMPDGTRLDDYVPMGVPKITDKETARLSPEAV